MIRIFIETEISWKVAVISFDIWECNCKRHNNLSHVYQFQLVFYRINSIDKYFLSKPIFEQSPRCSHMVIERTDAKSSFLKNAQSTRIFNSYSHSIIHQQGTSSGKQNILSIENSTKFFVFCRADTQSTLHYEHCI